jgi:hydroxypyruvate isomerase
MLYRLFILLYVRNERGKMYTVNLRCLVDLLEGLGKKLKVEQTHHQSPRFLVIRGLSPSLSLLEKCQWKKFIMQYSMYWNRGFAGGACSGTPKYLAFSSKSSIRRSQIIVHTMKVAWHKGF